MDERQPLPRRPGIDAVRAFAIFCVLVHHTASYALTGPVRSFGWVAAALWASVFRASVPLFFMCSGALLLDPERELPLRRLYGKNILKILIAALVWAAFYKVFHLLLSGGLSLGALWQGAKETLTFQHEFHLYFLHILLLVYAFLPLTRRFVRSATERELRYALALWFLLGVVYPLALGFWPFSLLTMYPRQWMLNMSYGAIGYGLLGCALVRRPLSRRAGWLLTGAGLVLIFVPTLLFSLRSGAFVDRFSGGMSVGVCLLAAGQFSLLFARGERMGPRAEKVALFLSRSSFCVYLSHVVWLNFFQRWGLTADRWPAVAAVPVFSLAIWALSLAVYLILSRIPVVKKWLI